jgi:hypothetical protein
MTDLALSMTDLCTRAGGLPPCEKALRTVGEAFLSEDYIQSGNNVKKSSGLFRGQFRKRDDHLWWTARMPESSALRIVSFEGIGLDFVGHEIQTP